MNDDLSTYMTHPFARANTSEADPVVERFRRDARAPGGFGNSEVIVGLLRCWR